MMTMFYRLKVRFLKTRRGNLFWRRWQTRRGRIAGNYNRLPAFICQHAPGRSFADIGCMWGVNGEYSFMAEAAGATSVAAVDVFGPTPEFEDQRQARGSAVKFILGDAADPAVLRQIGEREVVFCAGVLYHHPSPYDLLAALRRICGKILILRTSTIPEMNGLPNAAIYFPMLEPKDRKLWNLSSLGLLKQTGITDGFEAGAGYGNWFWGLTPSCLTSLLFTAGFRVMHRESEPFAQTFICAPINVPFAHRLPSESEARDLGKEISLAEIAMPA